MVFSALCAIAELLGHGVEQIAGNLPQGLLDQSSLIEDCNAGVKMRNRDHVVSDCGPAYHSIAGKVTSVCILSIDDYTDWL